MKIIVGGVIEEVFNDMDDKLRHLNFIKKNKIGTLDIINTI